MKALRLTTAAITKANGGLVAAGRLRDEKKEIAECERKLETLIQPLLAQFKKSSTK